MATAASARRTRAWARDVGLFAAAGLLLLSACASPAPQATPGRQADATAAGADAELYPFTIDNCGFEVTVESRPERVLTIKSSTLELMLALGLEDRIVGASFLDGPVPPAQAEAANRVDIVSEKAPGPEATLEMEPDMVFAGWESNFSQESAGQRETLTDMGVLTYVAPSACKASGYQPDPLTFEDVFADITEAGAVFGVPDAATALVAEQEAQLAEVVPDERGLDALWYSSGSDTPYVGAGIGAPQMIMDAVGVSNIAGAVRDTWTSFSWEQVVAEDPDLIILVDATWNTAENKIDVLESNPATAELTAVEQGDYLIVPFPATEAGVRNVAAAQDLADQLTALELDR